MGDGAVSVAAAREDGLYTTTVAAPAGLKLVIGHTLLAEQAVDAVELDGVPAKYTIVKTPRGQELHVTATTDAAHTLMIRVR